MSSNFVSLYTNDTQLQVTPWDVRMIFGEITEPASAERPVNVIKQIGEVRMSPQHAKIVMLILANQLEQYESNIGPIPLPTPNLLSK